MLDDKIFEDNENICLDDWLSEFGDNWDVEIVVELNVNHQQIYYEHYAYVHVKNIYYIIPKIII